MVSRVSGRDSYVEQKGLPGDVDPHTRPGLLPLSLPVCCSVNLVERNTPLRREVEGQAQENDLQLLAQVPG